MAVATLWTITMGNGEQEYLQETFKEKELLRMELSQNPN
jgi:hypothetical protein